MRARLPCVQWVHSILQSANRTALSPQRDGLQVHRKWLLASHSHFTTNHWTLLNRWLVVSAAWSINRVLALVRWRVMQRYATPNKLFPIGKSHVVIHRSRDSSWSLLILTLRVATHFRIISTLLSLLDSILMPAVVSTPFSHLTIYTHYPKTTTKNFMIRNWKRTNEIAKIERM